RCAVSWAAVRFCLLFPGSTTLQQGQMTLAVRPGAFVPVAGTKPGFASWLPNPFAIRNVIGPPLGADATRMTVQLPSGDSLKNFARVLPRFPSHGERKIGTSAPQSGASQRMVLAQR